MESLKNYRLIIMALTGIPVLLMTDSQYGDKLLLGYGQEFATLLVFIAFTAAYRAYPLRIKHVMLIGMFVGMAGELFLSLGLGMYHYRLENVPLWLLFGHGLIFALVFRISHKPWIIKKTDVIQNTLLLLAAFYSTLWLIWANDWFGFLCAIAFMVILFSAKKSRLFFLIMFTVVCYIELIGTATGCWYWPETAFNVPAWPTSGNPPSGIAVFYFVFDAIVFWVYMHLLHPKTKLRYQNSILRKSS
ncbi:hypothetical protein Ga0123462_1117 [Mariprofundus ferrinatatus]|uniref:Uncharacterized protein n=1 Tax=Mariprofundus ferrinatatus TaxID=1921087 RepID=A0A2K8L800_9PROT|nr:hypothetical protein [Mariprofundus ferrinatatus]ATX81981.1 hypothetical protein Ga0123462_1117 [Mariprofundus ferrinatatus]